MLERESDEPRTPELPPGWRGWLAPWQIPALSTLLGVLFWGMLRGFYDFHIFLGAFTHPIGFLVLYGPLIVIFGVQLWLLRRFPFLRAEPWFTAIAAASIIGLFLDIYIPSF